MSVGSDHVMLAPADVTNVSGEMSGELASAGDPATPGAAVGPSPSDVAVEAGLTSFNARGATRSADVAPRGPEDFALSSGAMNGFEAAEGENVASLQSVGTQAFSAMTSAAGSGGGMLQGVGGGGGGIGAVGQVIPAVMSAATGIGGGGVPGAEAATVASSSASLPGSPGGAPAGAEGGNVAEGTPHAEDSGSGDEARTV